MKNNIIILLILFFLSPKLFAENLQIQSKNILLDKDGKTSVFKNEVIVETKDKTIKGNYAEYNKEKGLLIIKNNVVATDNKGNLIKTELAEYYEKEKILISKGMTNIVTSEKYQLKGTNLRIDSQKKIISSENEAILVDLDGNSIYLSSFEYLINKNVFKSVGYTKIIDVNNNTIEFSQIYIDTKKKEVIGADVKAFINDKNFKVDERNEPRIFANSVTSDKDKSVFLKSVFTLCKFRENEKCPPWIIRSSKMLHDNKKKTIYYDHAIIKVYDIPVFYLPKLSHPDPSVERRSGFLPPAITDTKNLGEGIVVPYFFDIAKDKNFTLTSKLYTTENPLLLGEYNQALNNANLMADFGYTEGYKKASAKKKKGEKSHFFSKFTKNFKGKKNSTNNLSINIQDVSNDKYLKLYKIKSNLVDYNNDTLESSVNFTHQKDGLFFGFEASIYETLKENYSDKYEYILPELTFDKYLFNDERFGSLDLQSNFKVRNYDTNKLENFFINDFNWESKDFLPNNSLNTKLLGNIKNINYEVKNIENYKQDFTSELFGSIGLLSKINLIKKNNSSEHFLTPKMLIRLSPGSMRKETDGSRLNPIRAFNLNRMNNTKNYETGLSGTLGFDYNYEKENNKFDFSVAQVINEKENYKISDKTSMNEKLSDLVGTSKLSISDKINLEYNFALDQNYQDLNYNEINSSTKFGKLSFDFGYLEENKHLGDQKYLKTKINYSNNQNSLFSIENKRNLMSNSSEFYDLSYEYLNDCLRAGLVYRREFYNDSELEPENSLMFKITLTPFGKIDSPKINK